MKSGAVRRLRCTTVLAMAAVLFAPPSPAADLVDVRAFAGLPRAGITAGRAIAWRNISVVAQSDLLDAEVRVTTCAWSLAAASWRADALDTSCTDAAGATPMGGLGHQYGLTFKIPRWHDEAPFVDIAVRSWQSALRDTAARDARAGSTAVLVMTQPLGSFDAILGYSMPLTSSSQGDGIWRSTFAGLAWHTGPATTLEITADRGIETTTGALDRSLTLRIAHATPARAARLSAWATRAVDDPVDAWRIGVGFEVFF